jgi:hypothetical protein
MYNKKKITANPIAIHSGLNTHSQLHVIAPHNFNVMNIKNSIVGNVSDIFINNLSFIVLLMFLSGH